MAIGTSFKQQCPSCEAMVPVKDASMVGKRIECPKCKDKFIVKSPQAKKAVEEDEDDEALKANGKAVPAKVAGKKPGRATTNDDEDEEAPIKGKKTRVVEEDDEEEEEGERTKKKKAGTSRFTMGIALAVVGLLVLGAAAYFILFRPKTNPPLAKNTGKGNVPVRVEPDTPVAKEDKDKKEPSTEDANKQRAGDPPLSTATAELTNLLPSDTQHVAHVPFRVLFDPAGGLSTLREALFQNRDTLKDDFLRSQLGFSILAIDDLIRADRYGTGGWSFTVVHFHETVNQEAVKKALNLKPAPLVKNHTHYQVSAPNPWLEQLARVAIGVPRQLRSLPKQENRAVYVHFHNPRTIIFADEGPMVAFLKEDKRFKSTHETAVSSNPAPVKPAAADPPQATQAPPEQPAKKPTTGRPKSRPGKTAPKEAPKEQPMETPMEAPTDAPKDDTGSTPSAPARMEAYLTIKPALKAILDRMEATGAEGKDKVLFSSATDLVEARLESSLPENKGKTLWSPREIWDVTLLLHERNPRLRALGVALVQKEYRVFQLRNELHCPLENDASSLQQELAGDIAHDVARFIERFLAHKVEVPKKEEPTADPMSTRPAVPPGPIVRVPRGKPNEPAKDKKDSLPATSKITVTHDDKIVDFILDLKLEEPEMRRLQGVASLLAFGLRSAMEVAATTPTRHDLAKAGKLLPERGLSEQGVAPENYPPGVFPRRPSADKRYLREPAQRVSWMAGLLPFLGHETLYGKISFKLSWRDPINWVPAATMVPQFLDPTYPTNTYFLTRPDLPFELAATHFVGIAGVGLDAADYDPADPAVITKRGVMSYDKGVSLEEVRKGHGLGNTMLMIQVPPDSMAGVTPWLAGGGSTLRGVPDKNSVAPFVYSSTGKDGKARRGTYALMADGSVRFIDQNVSDEVFKAMASVQGPLPEGYDLNTSESNTPLVMPVKGAEVKKLPSQK